MGWIGGVGGGGDVVIAEKRRGKKYNFFFCLHFFSFYFISLRLGIAIIIYQLELFGGQL